MSYVLYFARDVQTLLSEHNFWFSVSTPYKYRAVAVGGTFDHIHKGHRSLLQRAFQTGEKVYIGLTSDDFARTTGKNIEHTFDQRKGQLREFLEHNYPMRNYEITKLESRFGPGIFTEEIQALVVSTETSSSVESANRRRRELRLPDLKVEVVPMILADDGSRISSTRIRSHEIDSEGHLVEK